jgi:hypothetical protein
MKLSGKTFKKKSNTKLPNVPDFLWLYLAAKLKQLETKFI